MGTELKLLVSNLDAIKRRKGDIEFWMARDLMRYLGYQTWENFGAVVEKAKMACASAGTDPDNHFRDVTKEIEAGKGAIGERADCYLSRYACYLIAMNGDPRKPEIGIAQTYFAVQTRRQEIADDQDLLSKRIEVRERVSVAVKRLNQAASNAGVQKYGLFHDAGYRGLYGMGLEAIKKRKNIPSKDDLLDHAGHTELAANEFRLTQTKDKLIRENVKREEHAIQTHRTVAEEVRTAIKNVGGTMPEDLSPEPSLKKLTSKRRKALQKPADA